VLYFCNDMVKSARPSRTRQGVKVAAFFAAWYAGVYVGLGVPVFLGLLIIAMFTCGTSEKWQGEESAYSVFNDGKRIAGTMTADQIDEQLKHGGQPLQSTPKYESSFVKNAIRGWGGGAEHSRSARPAAGSTEQEELRQRRLAAAGAAQARCQLQSSTSAT